MSENTQQYKIYRQSVSFRIISYSVLLTLLILTILLAVALGASNVPFSATLGVLSDRITGIASGIAYTAQQNQFIWDLRLPRALLAAVVGAGLSVVGAVLQSTVRNPIADPYVLGVTSGAGLGAVSMTVMGTAALAFSHWKFFSAFIGAIIALIAVLILSRSNGRYSPTRIVLAGVTLSYLFTGITSLMIFRSDDPRAAGSILFFLLGTLTQAEWGILLVPTIVVILGTVYAVYKARALDALSIGDETAKSLGFSVDKERAQFMIVAALVTGVLVAVAGGIGFVGLVIPHIVRIINGPLHRHLIVYSALLGAILLVLVDLICRFLVRPGELPVGVVTAVLGAPFFLYLLRVTKVR